MKLNKHDIREVIMKLNSDFNYLPIKEHSRELLERSINIAFGMLSNVQEKASMRMDINEDINDVKRVLTGKFKETNPFVKIHYLKFIIFKHRKSFLRFKQSYNSYQHCKWFS